MAKSDKNLLWILLIAVFSLAVHLLTYNTLGFHRDELLYLALGEHLSTGYWSNPPMIGFISFLSGLLPGDPLLTTRLFPAVAGAVLVLITGLIARELGGGGYAQILSCLVLSFSLLILRGFSMLQPVPFDILCWTLVLYWLLRYINTQKPVYILLVGVAFGLGLLNKYMVVFLAAGILMAVVLTPERKLWINKYTWIAAALTLLLFLPNLIWQYNHGFPVLMHMKELRETQLVHVKRSNILVDQLLMFTFGSVVWVAGLIWLLINRKAARFRVFGLIYLAVLALFLVLRGKSYYMAGMYPFMFAAGGVLWEATIKSVRGRIAFTAILILLSLPLAPGGIPFMSAGNLASYFSRIPPKMGAEALLRWEDGRMHPLPQDFADMLGWDELGNIAVKACDTLKDKSKLAIYAENYGQAGAIDHFGKPFHLPPAISFSDSYIMWMPDSVPYNLKYFIYVNDELGSDVKSGFATIDSLGSITNPYARELGTTVYLCTSPNKEFLAFVREKIQRVKRDRFR